MGKFGGTGGKSTRKTSWSKGYARVPPPIEFVRSSRRHITWSGSDALFARYSPLNYTVTVKLEFGVYQGHRKRHYSIQHIRIYLSSILNMPLAITAFQDIAAYWLKIATPPLYSVPPLGLKSSDLSNNHCWRKARMMGLSDSVRIALTFSHFDKIHAFGRTDRQTDVIVVSYKHYSVCAAACKNRRSKFGRHPNGISPCLKSPDSIKGRIRS